MSYFYELKIAASQNAEEARNRLVRVTHALSAAHGKCLREVISAATPELRERAMADQQEIMGALAELTSIELYLHAQEQMEKKGG